MDESDSSCDDLGCETLQKHAAVSTHLTRPPKAPRTKTLSHTHFFEGVSVPSRQVVEDKEIEIKHFVRIRETQEVEIARSSGRTRTSWLT